MRLRIMAGLLSLSSGGLAAMALYGSRRLTQRRVPDAWTNPADYGLDYEAMAFPSQDGLMLRGWFIPAPNARSTIVFCHGLMGSMDPDLQYAPWFHQAGYNVLMFDFRGHGRSDGQWISWGYYERRDLLGAIAYLKSRGIEEIGALGFSLGGAVAMATAAQSVAIRAVVSDCGFTDIRRTIRRAIMAEMPRYRLIATPLADLSLRVAGRRLGCDLIHFNPVRWVSQISPRPLLIIQGGQDPYVSVTDARRLYARAGQPKEIWVVPEAGHREVDRHQPEAYRQRLLAFFNRWL